MTKLFIKNILLGLDQFLNILLLGAPDETVSSRTGRAMRSGKPKVFVPIVYKILNKVFFIIANDKNHSIESIEHDCAKEGEIWSWIKD